MSSNIPEEIYLEIFSRLPVKSLIVFKCVCKTWSSLISDPDFAKMHLNLRIKRNKPDIMLHGYEEESTRSSHHVIYSISHDSLKSLSSTDKLNDYAVLELDYPFKSLGYEIVLMGCCDGLVCLWCRHGYFFCIWNPATREYKELPTSNIRCVNMVAFGFDSKNNDYKILAGFRYPTVFEVCWLGSSSWKRIENVVPYDFYDCKISGALVNGDLHWFAKRHDSTHVIVSLDISTEIFNEIELPQEVDQNDNLINLGVLEGCLCFLKYVRVFHKDHFEIWIMQSYGVRESWTKRYTVNNNRINPYGTYLRHIWSFKSGEILFGHIAGLVVYDSECGSVRKPNIPGLKYLYQEEPYFESLVSLKSGTYYVEITSLPMKDDNLKITKLNSWHYPGFLRYRICVASSMLPCISSSAIGLTLTDDAGNIREARGEPSGWNNREQLEMNGAEAAFQWAGELGGRDIEFQSDSEPILRNLIELYAEKERLKNIDSGRKNFLDFKAISFNLVKRVDNFVPACIAVKCNNSVSSSKWLGQELENLVWDFNVNPEFNWPLFTHPLIRMF